MRWAYSPQVKASVRRILRGLSQPTYRTDLLLGTGGMAEVWRGVGPEGAVAIKRLLPHAARDPSMAAGFEREGRVLQRIRHPHIIRIFRTGRDAGGPYLVLEYVDGAPLRKLCGEPIEPRLALRVAHDVLSGLEVVHGLCDESGRSLGLLHRDLSPSNVLLGEGGEIKVTDFGIARATSGSDATTGSTIRGTLAYMSPEQASGLPIDARSDLFAVGSLLYEMLTGVPVYEDADPRLALFRARAAEIRSIEQLRPDLPMDVIELVDRVLAAAPADRLPTAKAMRREVERVALRTVGLATRAEVAQWVRRVPHPGPPSAEKPPSLSRPLGVGFGIGLLGVGGVLAVPLAMRARAHDPPAVVQAATLTAANEPEPSPSIAVDIEPVAVSPSPNVDRPEARPVAQVAFGSLDIGSEPGFAYVTLDGKRLGSTPVFGRRVAPGRHYVTVSRAELGSKTIVVDVKPGARVSKVVQLR